MKEWYQTLRKEMKDIKFTEREVTLLFSTIVTLIITLSVLIILVRQDHIVGIPHNLRTYIICAFVFFVTAFISIALGFRLNKTIKINHTMLVLGGGLLTIISYGLWKCYVNSSHVYPYLSHEWLPWHSLPNRVIALFFLMVVTLGLVGVLILNKKISINNKVLYIIYFVVALVGGMALYHPNFVYNDMHHGNAYFNSIYNVLKGSAYSVENQSIYGRYAIILKYPILLFGGDYMAFNIIMVVCGMISIYCTCLVIHKCIQNGILKILSSISLLLVYYIAPQNKWQLYPHRILFSSILLYLMLRKLESNSKKLSLAGYVIGALAVLWNVETGIVCLAAWALCLIVKKYLDTGKVLLLDILLNGVGVILSAIGSWLLFEVYNIIHGGKILGVWDYLFPIVTVSGRRVAETTTTVTTGQVNATVGQFVNVLSILLPYENSPWYYVFTLFGIAALIFFVGIFYKKVSKIQAYGFLVTVLALGKLVYFFNRPDFSNLSISYAEAIIILVILIDSQSKQSKQQLWKILPMRVLIIGIISILAGFSIWLSGYRLFYNTQQGNYNIKELNALLEDMEKNVPPDTLAIGSGAQEIYAQLGWDTKTYIIDFSDMTTPGWRYLFALFDEMEEGFLSVRQKETRGILPIEEYMKNFTKRGFEVLYSGTIEQESVWKWDFYYVRFLPENKVENK